MVTIVHIIISLESGGAERFLQRLIKESSKREDIKQTVLTLKDEGLLAKEVRDLRNNVEVIPLNMKSILEFPLILLKLIRFLRSIKPNIVFTWMYHSDFIGGLAAYLCGIRNIHWGIRCTDIPQSKLSVTSILIKLCALLSFFIPKSIICNSQSGKQFHGEIGYCKTKLIVINNGYDLSLFEPSLVLRKKVRQSLSLNDDHHLVGFVARFDFLKDIPNFISAASIINRTSPDVKFLMVGEGLEADNIDLMSLINKSTNPYNFILCGRSPPHDFFASMDVFTLSSISEGFPNVVAEAMAMKIPCVVTDVGDASLIVDSFGRVVERMNAKALAEGIMEMLRLSNQERRSIGSGGRKSIEQRFSIDNVTKAYLNLIPEMK